MRIAYYLVDHTAIGGIQTHLVTLATAVSQLGHDVHVILPATAVLDPLVPQLEAEDVTVHRLPASPVGRRARLEFFAQLVRLLRQIQPQIMHIQQSIPGYDQKAPLAAWLARVPATIITEHDFPRPQGRLRTLLMPLLVHLVDRVITVSNFSRHLLANDPYPLDKISVVYNGINLEAFHCLSEKAKENTEIIEQLGFSKTSVSAVAKNWHPFIIGYLGRLEPHKGIDDLLHAAALLLPTQPDLHVNIAGNGPERPFLEALAQTLGITSHVHFLGRVPDAANFLRQLDIFVLPSRFEAFGLVAVEAMAVGTAVIVSNAGGLPEVVAHGETGLVVPVDDRPALAQAIAQLANNPIQQQQLIQAGKQRSATCFSAQRMAADTVRLYKN
ncbi:MAG: glycosyltransferase family 4 protein [Ardenticatenaceae bacterium]|nr:glycosyltransferase family 4 protein [Anaerolineales bacterium]MCB8937804.1 glycosyltransferase family 4 protein [Ardenticatenaceae bacterium]MCB8974373.1 glycosyltransferase family 4 protein [Ardenticatenaceae bacterium]